MEHRRKARYLTSGRRWRQALLLLLIFSVGCLAVLLFSPGTRATPEPEFIPVSLHSVLRADYSSALPTPIPAAALRLIADTLWDEEPEADDIAERVAKVVSELNTPVPNVDPLVVTSTPTAIATNTPHPTPTASPTPIATPSATKTPSATITLTAVVTSTSAAVVTATAPPTATSTSSPSPTVTASADTVPLNPVTPTVIATSPPPDAPVWVGRRLESVQLEGGLISVVRVWVRGQVGLPVRIESEGGWDTVGVVGTKEEYGPDALEVSPLPPGRYTITPAGLDITVTVEVVAGEIAQVLFEQE